MTCRACENLLQMYLDGVASPGDLERILYTCPDCAAERAAIQKLLEGVSRLRPPAVPTELTERLVVEALAEIKPPVSRLRQVRWAAALAAAAAVWFAVGIWALRPMDGPMSQPTPAVADQQPPPLRDSMDEAQNALVALTSRTATETVETTSHLWPTVTLEPVVPPIEPAIEPLREATSGVADAVSPVADSARRAVGLFFRDLPMGRAPCE